MLSILVSLFRYEIAESQPTLVHDVVNISGLLHGIHSKVNAHLPGRLL